MSCHMHGGQLEVVVLEAVQETSLNLATNPIILRKKPCAMNLLLTLYWHYGELCGSYAMCQFSLIHHCARSFLLRI